MKNISIISVLLLGIVLSACTSQRYTTSNEYDDVYYTRADQPAPEQIADTRTQYDDPYDADRYDSEPYNTDRTFRQNREPVDSYYDTYYSNDDFHYSRRIRRFQTGRTGSWRYYDPYFANDLYFVMGTNSWNRWYNDLGWYSWNSPRFGSPYRPYNGWDNWYWNGYNNWSTWGNPYYNPWVGSFYGYNAGVGFYDPWANPWGGGGFFGPGVYCPPGYYPQNSGAVILSAANNSRPVTVTRRRNSTVSSRSQTRLTPRANGTRTLEGKAETRTPGMQRPAIQRTDYTRPRPAVDRTTNPTRQTGVQGQRPGRSIARPQNQGAVNRNPRTPRTNRNTSPSVRQTNRGRVNRNTSPSRAPQVRQRNYSQPRNSGNTGGSIRRSNNSSPSMQRNSGGSVNRNTSPSRSNRNGGGNVRRRNN